MALAYLGELNPGQLPRSTRHMLHRYGGSRVLEYGAERGGMVGYVDTE